jgi:hypothetical protein
MSCDEGERRGKWEVQDGRSTIVKKCGKLGDTYFRKFMHVLGHSSTSRSITISPFDVSSMTDIVLGDSNIRFRSTVLYSRNVCVCDTTTVIYLYIHIDLQFDNHKLLLMRHGKRRRGGGGASMIVKRSDLRERDSFLFKTPLLYHASTNSMHH